MKNCKECLYYKMCPFNITSVEANQCKTYEAKEEYVKVVRCKDCVHRDPDDGWCKLQAEFPRDNDYCHRGQKKVNTNEQPS